MTFALRLTLSTFLALLAVAPARAIVGPSADGAPYAAHAIMVLAHGARGAGFCSGAIVAPDIVLTAAHCVAAPATTRVHFRDANGAPRLVAVRRIARHPQYRADAVAARARSVDLALVETATALPPSFQPVAIAAAPKAVGATLEIAGFGLRQEGAPATSGVLRSARLTLRAPLSELLLWLDDPDGAGACTGDSGAPVFWNGALVGVVAYAQGPHRRGCGGLTQAVRTAPAAAWIERTIAGWR